MGIVGAFRSLLKATESKDVILNSPDGWVTEAPWMIYSDPTYGPGGPGAPIGTGGTFSGIGLPGDDYHPRGALAIPGVARATGLIVDPLVSVSWGIYRKDDNDIPVELPTPTWMSDPQNLRFDNRVLGVEGFVRYSSVEFWSEWITSALLIGDGLIYSPRLTDRGELLAPLFLLNPDQIDIKEGKYFAKDYEIPGEHIIHIRAAPPYKDGRGVGVLRRHSIAFAMGNQVRSFASSTFRSGVPAGYLKSTTPGLTQDQADAMKAKWLAVHGGDTRSIAVLNATTDFVPIMWSPVDADLIDMNKWNLLDIALAFGIEPYMLGVTGDTSTYANVESRIKQNRQTSLVWAKRIEAVLESRLPLGQYPHIRLDELLRPDTIDRYTAYTNALNAGWMTIDEVRRAEQLPPLPKEELIKNELEEQSGNENDRSSDEVEQSE